MAMGLVPKTEVRGHAEVRFRYPEQGGEKLLPDEVLEVVVEQLFDHRGQHEIITTSIVEVRPR